MANITKIQLPNAIVYPIKAAMSTMANVAITANKLANDLTIKSDATYASSAMKTGYTYNGSSAVTANITPAAIGALDLSGGTVTGNVNIKLSDTSFLIGPTNATNAPGINIQIDNDEWSELRTNSLNGGGVQLSARDSGSGFSFRAISSDSDTTKNAEINLYGKNGTVNGGVKFYGDVYIASDISNPKQGSRLFYSNTNWSLNSSTPITIGNSTTTDSMYAKIENTKGDVSLLNSASGYRGIFYEGGKGLIYLDPNGVVRQSCGTTALGLKMYYSKGDTISVTGDQGVFTSGFVTTNRTEIRFSISLAYPIVDDSTIVAASVSDGGIIIRQNNDYRYGSQQASKNGWIKPTRYDVKLEGATAITICAFCTADSTATNNDSCGINWKGILTLS